MTTKIIDLRNFYKVIKTITFELKSNESEDQCIQFQKTFDFIAQKYFLVSKKSSDGIDELEKMMQFGSKLVDFSSYFNNGLIKKSFDWFGFNARKTLIEKFDRDAYHRLKKNKKGIIITLRNIDTGREYEKQLIFQDPMPLYDVIMMTDKTGYQLTDYIDNIERRIKFFQNKIEKDLLKIYSKYTETEKVNYYESGKVVFYGFVRSYLSLIKDLMAIFDLISVSPQNVKELSEKEYTLKVKSDLGFIKNEYEKHQQTILSIEEIIDEEVKKPIILTTLNPRAVNKDPKKIEEEYNSVLDMEEKKKNLEWKLEALNNEKFTVVQNLENKLKDVIPELAILKQDIQPIINKKKYNGYSSLTNEEKDTLQKHKFAKTILKYIKMEGIIVRYGKNDIINYRQSGERLAYKPKQIRRKNPSAERFIENNPDFNKFWREYCAYTKLCEEKKSNAVALGNLKSVYNAIGREILRQKEMQYLSILAKDNDYFYLVLIDKDYNKEKSLVEELQKNNHNSEWQMLEYHKITFKAIEKLSLLEAATFDIEDRHLQDEAKSLWRSYKEKWFKEYADNRALQGLYGYQKEQKKTEFEKTELVKIIDFIQRVIAILPDCKNYNFNFKKSEEYLTLEDFADEIDKYGYASKWVSLNKKVLFTKEKELGGNVLVFKLHNKDFRKRKQPLSDGRDEKERKVNLFTKYWLDAMKLGREIRITPEIDIFKRKKEESESEFRILKTSNKEVVNKARNYHDKLYGAFKVEFYPDKKSDFVAVNEKVRFNDPVYYLGLDRGEKSLVSWCLIDSNGKLIKKGDWTTMLNSVFKGVNYAEKLNFTKDENGKTEASGFRNARIMLSEKYQKVSDCKNEEEKKILLEETQKREKEFDIDGLLAAEQIKKGYCSYLINEINQILKEYPNTYIVLEDLDMKYNKNGTLKTGDENIDNKIKNLEKTLGGTVYQAVENAIVNKFKYYTVKDKNEYEGLQLVPNIVKVEDLRVKENDMRDNSQFNKVKWVKSKEKIGNILFVDEYLTSDTCSHCGFNKDKINYIQNSVITKTDEEFVLSITNEKYVFPKKWFKKIKFDRSLLSVRMKNNHYCEIEVKKKDYFYCPKCLFSSENNIIDPNLVVKNEAGEVVFQFKNGDDIAAYNIAKSGLEILEKIRLEV